LVLGGIASGKSVWAEAAITASVSPADPVRYIATGATTDPDPAWASRIAAHRARRPPHWSTVETGDVAAVLRADAGVATLVDDMGCWLLHDRDYDELLRAVGDFEAPLVLVSPEVGLTVVPPTESGRRFADLLGALNQRLAGVCEKVVLVVAGQPLTVKDAHGR
jgi:adenosylcobinamide kinase / adenosylcobinamide-phosphate guanylyltransferase